MHVAVAGGTGVVGSHVVRVAQASGHDVMVLTRSRGFDLTSTGSPDLSGVDAVIDVTSAQAQSTVGARAFFRTVTSNLLRAESAAGVRHHLALSIVGIEHAPTGYYAGKLMQESMIEGGAVPWTILRATQFHEFALQGRAQLKLGPLRVVPKMLVQPVAASEVADRLVALAEGEPAGRVPDLGGPRDERLAHMLRAYNQARQTRGWVVHVPIPGRLGRALRDGSLTAAADAEHGTLTFEDWLSAQAHDNRDQLSPAKGGRR